jgi:hypothetical protein
MYQYALGRSLQSADQSALDAIAQRFEDGHRTYHAAMLSVVNNPAFQAPAPIQ